MRQKWLLHLIALSSFLVLALSFLWCIVDDILTSAEMAKAGVVMPVTSITMIGGMLWLIAHGIHGAAAIVFPALILRRPDTSEEVYAY
jgi:hypothetical protein